jgi:NAD(P)-dependent dehydrogenase (short-subunit alcohol dehydrogenase family)
MQSPLSVAGRSLSRRLATELRENGGHAIAAPADVTSREQATVAIGAAVERFGGIDVLVNNAGGGTAQRYSTSRSSAGRRRCGSISQVRF